MYRCINSHRPHFSSSEPSAQSFSPSHRKVSGIQRVLLSQRWWQPSLRLAQSISSDRSWQSYCPSHTCTCRMHLFPWEHWNSSGKGKNIILDTWFILLSIAYQSLCDYELLFRHFACFHQFSAQTWFTFSSTSLFVWSILAVPLSVTHMAVHDTVEAIFTWLEAFAAFQRGWSGTKHIERGLAERKICI